MYFPVSNRALLQGMLASALVLAGTSACSRPDRTESGSTDAAGVRTDTLKSAGDNAAPGAGSGSDTAADSLTTASPSRDQQDASGQLDSSAPGYRAMERDTAAAPPASETSLQTSDTTSAGYVEMARDTTRAPDQIDTASVSDTAGTDQVGADADSSATVAVVSDSGSPIRPPEDSSETLGQVTTGTSTAAAADTSESERIRPPEDSTEFLGEASPSETADEEPVNAAEAVPAPDRETVAASEARTEEVGAAAMGGTVTGGEAVALLTRQGAQCAMVDPESNEAVRWDMSSTPVTLNPCGMGSMNLSKVWTSDQRGSGAAGQ